MSDNKIRITYDEIHQTIGQASKRIKEEFKPDLMIAIGGGGFFPARVLRTFLKTRGAKNIPILAIGLSLYEEMEGTSAEKLGKEVIRTQWLEVNSFTQRPLLGRNILIVDEVDDSRTTLQYAVSELKKDVQEQLAILSEEERKQLPPTKFGVFVVHNKDKAKNGTLPADIAYFAGAELPDKWVDYPWEQEDIVEHNRLAALAREGANAQ